MRAGYRLILVVIVLLLTASLAQAKTPLGGLAVAASPDGQVIVAGGDSRVLYVLDGASLEVKQRVWLKTTITNLYFNKTGSRLLVEDTDETVYLVDTQGWKVEKEVKKAGYISPAPAADLCAAWDDNYNGHVIRFLSMTDLSEKGKVSFEKGKKVQAFGLSPDGERLAVFLEGAKDESEPVVKDVPKDLKGLALEEFKQKNDGKTTPFQVFDVQRGMKAVEKTIFYSFSGTGAKVFFSGDDVCLVNYGNLNVRVTKDGAASLFQLDNSFNYGLGLSGDQKTLLTGGLANGTVTKVDGLKMTAFKLDRLPGWPEYFKDFAVLADGSAYGGTTGFRLVKISATGQVEKSVPIF